MLVCMGLHGGTWGERDLIRRADYAVLLLIQWKHPDIRKRSTVSGWAYEIRGSLTPAPVPVLPPSRRPYVPPSTTAPVLCCRWSRPTLSNCNPHNEGNGERDNVARSKYMGDGRMWAGCVSGRGGGRDWMATRLPKMTLVTGSNKHRHGWRPNHFIMQLKLLMHVGGMGRHGYHGARPAVYFRTHYNHGYRDAGYGCRPHVP